MKGNKSFLASFSIANADLAAAFSDCDVAYFEQGHFFNAQAVEHEDERGEVPDGVVTFEVGEGAADVGFEGVDETVVFVICEGAVFGGGTPCFLGLDIVHELWKADVGAVVRERPMAGVPCAGCYFCFVEGVRTIEVQGVVCEFARLEGRVKGLFVPFDEDTDMLNRQFDAFESQARFAVEEVCPKFEIAGCRDNEMKRIRLRLHG